MVKGFKRLSEDFIFYPRVNREPLMGSVRLHCNIEASGDGDGDEGFGEGKGQGIRVMYRVERMTYGQQPTFPPFCSH